MDQNQMRIQVNADGNVEFSVSLSGEVDPALVASMVAAVRRGIVATSPTPQKPSPPHSPPQPPQQSPPISTHTTPPEPVPEPTSDPDPDAGRVPDRNCERAPSPLVVSAARKLSVRQIAAEIDASPDSRLPNPYNEYDTVREFSSSPSLWLTSNNPTHVDPDPPRSQSSAYSLRPSASIYDVKPARRVRSERPTDRVIEPKTRGRLPTMIPHQSSSALPVRMLSLPSGINHENVNEMYFTRHQSEHTADQALVDQQRRPPEQSTSFDLVQEREILVEEKPIGHEDHLDEYIGNIQNPASSQRSISDLTDSHGLDGERSVTPTSPYVQQPEPNDGDPNDAWDNVEYVLTESYRNDPKASDINDRDSHGTPSNSRSAAWRLFTSIGTSLRRRQDSGEDIHQNTLAAGSGYNDKLIRRRRALFTRNNVRNGTLWMEFTSPLGAERMLAEVGKISKALGYQVWRRPGENKLRCIRRLNHRQEMHLVVLVGSIRLPDGHLSVVRLRRARGDRNRTEGWRYAHFYRELVDRLQRYGIEITAGE